MATYLTTVKFTREGIKSIDETTKRAAAFRAAVRKMGVRVRDVFWTMGSYDGLLVLEAPDEETAAAALIHLAAAGNVHTSTVRAFTAAEMGTNLTKARAG
jgi:uncharacterized protein with GYD domain